MCQNAQSCLVRTQEQLRLSTLLLAQGFQDSPHRGRGIVHPYDQPGVAFVAQAYHHRLLWIMHVPEHSLTLLVEGASTDHPRYLSGREPETLPPLWVPKIGI